MSRRLRRLPVLLLPLVLSASLVACGSDSGSDGTDAKSDSSSSDALHGIAITGDVGKAPEVKWNGKLDVSKTDSTVVTEGDGDKIAAGDEVVAHLWLGDGTTQKQAYSTFDTGQTENIPASDDMNAVFKAAVLDQTIGSRVAVTAPASELFGDTGNAQMGIGNEDSILVIVDLMEPFQAPKPKDVPSSQMPSIIEKKGEPVGLDFTGIAKPKADDDLKRSVIKEGTGATVTTDMTIKADYLGQTYGAKAPFDESFSKQPAEFALTGVVEGWTYGLAGLKVGSRVLLAIPPAMGYGAQEQSGIPANSTLYFVVDILSAK